MKSITRVALLSIAFFMPALALAAVSSVNFDIGDVANNLIGIINDILVPLIFAVAFIVFLYGVMKTYVLSSGDESAVVEGHKLILWGIIGFVVMVSVWGMVNIVSNTFLLSNPYQPDLPGSRGVIRAN